MKKVHFLTILIMFSILLASITIHYIINYYEEEQLPDPEVVISNKEYCYEEIWFYEPPDIWT